MSPPSTHLFLNTHSSSLIICPSDSWSEFSDHRPSLDHCHYRQSADVNWSRINVPTRRNSWQQHTSVSWFFFNLLYPDSLVKHFPPLDKIKSKSILSLAACTHTLMYVKSMEEEREAGDEPRRCSTVLQGWSRPSLVPVETWEKNVPGGARTTKSLPCSIYSSKKMSTGDSWQTTMTDDTSPERDYQMKKGCCKKGGLENVIFLFILEKHGIPDAKWERKVYFLHLFHTSMVQKKWREKQSSKWLFYISISLLAASWLPPHYLVAQVPGHD